MKFTPRELEGNLNVSSTHPLAEFAWLVGGVVAVLATVYILLGLTADFAADRIPPEAENWLGQRALAAYPEESDPALEQRLQELIRVLPADSPLRRYRFSVHLVKSETVNAVALPGGNIIVFSGLIRKVKSENELSMVLAHELGHYAHRDHLRGLGRGLGLAVATQLLLGSDNAASQLVSSISLPLVASYSQAQEAAADDFGVDLTVFRFGHAGGTADFFSHVSAEAGERPPDILASHPHPALRISRIHERITRKGYPVRSVVPLGADLVKAIPVGQEVQIKN